MEPSDKKKEAKIDDQTQKELEQRIREAANRRALEIIAQGGPTHQYPPVPENMMAYGGPSKASKGASFVTGLSSFGTGLPTQTREAPRIDSNTALIGQKSDEMGREGTKTKEKETAAPNPSGHIDGRKVIRGFGRSPLKQEPGHVPLVKGSGLNSDIAILLIELHNKGVEHKKSIALVTPSIHELYPEVPLDTLTDLIRGLSGRLRNLESFAPGLLASFDLNKVGELLKGKIKPESEEKHELANTVTEITVHKVRPHPTGEKGASLEIPIPKTVREMTGINRDTFVYLKVDSKKRIILEKVPETELTENELKVKLSTAKRE